MNATPAAVTVHKRPVIHHVWALALSAAALAAMPLSTLAAHSTYSFTRIADDTGHLAEIGIAPVAINDAGQVAFLANLNTGDSVVFVGSGGPLTAVAESAGHFRLLGFPIFLDLQKATHGFPSINGLGQVSFGATRLDGVSGVFAGVDGAIPSSTTASASPSTATPSRADQDRSRPSKPRLPSRTARARPSSSATADP